MKLMSENLRLLDYFWRGEINLMKTSQKIKAEVNHASG
jgi:hypothetical protein